MYIQPYLYFGGRCQEALDFYAQAVGATLVMKMHFNESPMPIQPGMIPDGFETKIMHSTMKIGDSLVMATDGHNTSQHHAGYRLSLSVKTPEEAQKVYAALCEGGTVQMPLSKTFWSPLFGMLTDRFGVGWMVTVATT